jgi:hypothetical protein
MADNTPLNPGTGGDVIRTVPRNFSDPEVPTPSIVKTEVVQLDFGGDVNGASQESLVSAGNPLPVSDPYTVMMAKIALQSLLLAQAAQIGGFVPLDPSVAGMLDIQQ